MKNGARAVILQYIYILLQELSESPYTDTTAENVVPFTENIRFSPTKSLEIRTNFYNNYLNTLEQLPFGMRINFKFFPKLNHHNYNPS